MSIMIRNAVGSDCEKIRPLQKKIADLHHNGRPDLFKPRARYFEQKAFDARLSNPNHFIFIAEDGFGKVAGYVSEPKKPPASPYEAAVALTTRPFTSQFSQ